MERISSSSKEKPTVLACASISSSPFQSPFSHRILQWKQNNSSEKKAKKLFGHHILNRRGSGVYSRRRSFELLRSSPKIGTVQVRIFSSLAPVRTYVSEELNSSSKFHSNSSQTRRANSLLTRAKPTIEPRRTS